MSEPTIYNYRYIARFRWRTGGLIAQFTLLAILSWLILPVEVMTVRDWLCCLALLPLLPVIHFLLFRFYAYCHQRPAHTSPDGLVSAWWGAGTRHPAPLPFFRGAETTVCAGSLLIMLAAYPWLSPAAGGMIALGWLVCALPRLGALVLSLKQPPDSRVKYEERSIAFLLTDAQVT